MCPLLLPCVTACLLAVPPVAPAPREAAKEEQARQQNLGRLAALYDTMTPEAAAPILKQMIESGPGKLEQAVEIILRMKERSATRLLEAMNDPVLAAAIMDRVNTRKAPRGALPVAPAPRPVRDGAK